MIIEQSEARSHDISAASDEPRMEMKPAGSATGYMDGGWWPRSTDPASEFPGLIGALHEQVGQVSRVAYNLDFWATVHRKLTVDGRVVRCEGFHTMNAHTVTAIGVDSRRVTVLVVPRTHPMTSHTRRCKPPPATTTPPRRRTSSPATTSDPTGLSPPWSHQVERTRMRRHRTNAGKTKAARSLRMTTSRRTPCDDQVVAFVRGNDVAGASQGPAGHWRPRRLIADGS